MFCYFSQNYGALEILLASHSLLFKNTGPVYQKVPRTDDTPESSNQILQKEMTSEDSHTLALWRQQFVDALMVLYYAYIFNPLKPFLNFLMQLFCVTLSLSLVFHHVVVC